MEISRTVHKLQVISIYYNLGCECFIFIIGKVYKTNQGMGNGVESDGNIGKLTSDEFGNAYFITKTPKIKLIGDNSIIGRSCVIKEIDEFTKTYQKQTKSIAIGIIGICQ